MEMTEKKKRILERRIERFLNEVEKAQVMEIGYFRLRDLGSIAERLEKRTTMQLSRFSVPALNAFSLSHVVDIPTSLSPTSEGLTRMLGALAAPSLLASLQELSLDGNVLPLSMLLPILCPSPLAGQPLAPWTLLSLSCMGLGDLQVVELVEALLAPSNAKQPLRLQLDLKKNGLSDASAEALSRLLALGKLRVLDIADNRVSDAGMATLLAALSTNPAALEVLSFSRNRGTTDATTEMLAGLLAHGWSLCQLQALHFSASRAATATLIQALAWHPTMLVLEQPLIGGSLELASHRYHRQYLERNLANRQLREVTLQQLLLSHFDPDLFPLVPPPLPTFPQPTNPYGPYGKGASASYCW